jgi:hypothetical protein
MKRYLALALFGLALSACGQSAPPTNEAPAEGAPAAQQTAARGCALLLDASAFFGQAMTGEANARGAVADGCRWSTADELYSAEVMIFTDASLAGAVTVQQNYERTLVTFSQMSNQPLAPIADLGIAAQRADLGRRMSQIAFYKDGVGVLVSVNTPTPDSESPPALAERLARAIDAQL